MKKLIPRCKYCDGKGRIEPDNNGPISPCPVCRPEPRTLIRGEAYNFRNQSEKLKYIGKKGLWHQFERIGYQGVWCEILSDDLHMIEKTGETT